MKISFSTRSAARSFNAKRLAKGFTGRVIDNGKDAVKEGKVISRYSVSLR